MAAEIRERLYAEAMQEYESDRVNGDRILENAEVNPERARRFARSVFAGKVYASVGAPIPDVSADRNGRLVFDEDVLTPEMTETKECRERRLPEGSSVEDDFEDDDCEPEY